MKKILFLFCLFFAVTVVAQETIVLPSTFNESQMIIHKRDEKGNFVAVYQTAVSQENSDVKEENLQGVKLKIKESVQDTEKETEEKKFKTFELKMNADTEGSKKENEAVAEPEKEGDSQAKAEPKRTRKFRAREKEYGIPKTTFDDSTLQEATAFSGSTFDTSTMKETVKEFKRESTIFEECDSDDPDCKTYELDEEGQVIF